MCIYSSYHKNGFEVLHPIEGSYRTGESEVNLRG